MSIREQGEKIERLINNIKKVIVGKDEVICLALIPLCCKGHLLIEDVPGVGKTMLARSIAKSINGKFRRIQFTPDLLPSDVTGVSIYNQKNGEFEFKPGPVFANILLADEINRTTPRTQSALLECMEETQVTESGRTYLLEQPFNVIATQNPIELQGTYPLPEAQLDRFFMKLKIGYPDSNSEVTMMEEQVKEHPIFSLIPVLETKEIVEIQETIKEVYIDHSVKEYIVRLINKTREHKGLLLGASPRGSLALMRASQAWAFFKKRDFVDPTDVKNVALPTLSHRIILKPQTRLEGVNPEELITEILNSVPVPVLPLRSVIKS